MATRAELITYTLRHMGVLDPIEEPSAEDEEAVGVWADAVRAELLELGSCWWDEDAIPAAVLGPLIILVGSRACFTFGKPQFGNDWADGMRRINSLASSEERPVTQAVYY